MNANNDALERLRKANARLRATMAEARAVLAETDQIVAPPAQPTYESGKAEPLIVIT